MLGTKLGSCTRAVVTLDCRPILPALTLIFECLKSCLQGTKSHLRYFKINIFCLQIYWLCAWYSWRPKEGIECLGTGLANSCESPWRGRELNPSPSEEQSLLLRAEPSLLLGIIFLPIFILLWLMLEELFYIYIHEANWSVVFLSCNILFGFVSGVMLSL